MIITGDPKNCKCCGRTFYHVEGIYIENDEQDFFVCGNCFIRFDEMLIDVKDSNKFSCTKDIIEECRR